MKRMTFEQFLKQLAMLQAMQKMVAKAFKEQKPYETLSNNRIELKFCIN